jgi:nitronate monooxygenase
LFTVRPHSSTIELPCVTIGGAATVDEAVALEAAGVDMVVASGFEAGGHRTSFLRPSEEVFKTRSV